MQNDLKLQIQESVSLYFTTNEINHLKSLSTEPNFNELIVDYILLLDMTIQDKQPLVGLIKQLEIPSELLLCTLDTDLLVEIGLIDDAKFVDRKIIRANTNLLYKQTRYNLLREESEGYSKLVVLVIEGLVLPVDVYFNRDEKNFMELRSKDLQKTHQIVENIRKLIGYFDLDPNRVLDILLDLFIANFLDYWDYFLLLFQGLVKTQNNLGQLLGFKYQSYQEAPVQLYYVSAILIKHSLLKIEDLYPFLNEKPYDQYKKELKEQARNAGRFVRVVMGELGAVEQTQEKQGKSRNCQKSGLLECALAIGDLQTSLKLLSKAKFIDKDIGYNICRIIHLLVDQFDTRIFKPKSKDLSLFCPPVSSYQTSCGLSTRVYTGKKHYPSLFRFFYPWKDALIKELDIRDSAETKDEVLKVLNQINGLLNHASVYLSSDNLLLGKLVRFGTSTTNQGKHLLKTELEQECKQLLSEYILPSVSMTQTNPNISNEIWKIMKQFDYKVRYALYGEWRHITYSRIDVLQIASSGNRKDIQYIMNRLSKENVKLNGRQIGKIVHSNPTLTFSYIINMIESYDNMIPFVVEATRYLTDLDLDILCFSLLESVSKPKEKIEPNGTTIEKWLKSLSTFSGTLFKKHSIDLQGLIQYICNQLANNQIYDLIILQDLLTQMGGTSLPEEATAVQIESLAGGELLRKEGYLNNQKSLKKTSTRLMKHLKANMMKLGILIAQQQQQIIYRQKDEFDLPSLKILGWLNDLCLKSFLQYFEFVFDNCSEYPTFEYLVERISIPFAFHIYRQKIIVEMQGRETREEVDDRKEVEEEEEEMQVDELEEGKDEENREDVKAETVEVKETEEMQVDEDEKTEQLDEKSSAIEDDMQVDIEIHPVLQTLSNQILQLNLAQPEYVDFYSNFWCLSLSDILVPTKRYEIQMKKHKQVLADLEKAKNDSKNRKEKERVLSIQLQIVKEFNTQKHFHKKTMERLKLAKSGWFKEERTQVPEYILEQVFERCNISPADAIFGAQYIKLLHTLGTENLSTLLIYDKILDGGSMHSILFSLTEFEAKNYGLFLSSILETLTRWYKDEAVYDSVTKDVPGFKKDVDEILPFSEFKQLMINWHLQLRQCFLECLKSGEYMQMRNSIIVLDKINDFYPTIDFVGQQIEVSIMKIEQNEVRGDMKQLARSYYAKIQHSKKQWKPIECVDLEPTIQFAGQKIAFKQLQIDENDRMQKVEPLAWAKPAEEKSKVREWDRDKDWDRKERRRDDRDRDRGLRESKDSRVPNRDNKDASRDTKDTSETKDMNAEKGANSEDKHTQEDVSKRIFTIKSDKDVVITIEKPGMEVGELDEGEIDEKNDADVSQWSDKEKEDAMPEVAKEAKPEKQEVNKQPTSVDKTSTKPRNDRNVDRPTPNQTDRDRNDRDRRLSDRDRRNDKNYPIDRLERDRTNDRNWNEKNERLDRDRDGKTDRNSFGNDRPDRGTRNSFGNDRNPTANDRTNYGNDRQGERDRNDRNTYGNDRNRDRNDQFSNERLPDRNDARRNEYNRPRPTDRSYKEDNDHGKDNDRNYRNKERISGEERNRDSDRARVSIEHKAVSPRVAEQDRFAEGRNRQGAEASPETRVSADSPSKTPISHETKPDTEPSPTKPIVPEDVLRKISLVKSQIEKSAGLDKEQVLKQKIELEKKNRELKRQEDSKSIPVPADIPKNEASHSENAKDRQSYPPVELQGSLSSEKDRGGQREPIATQSAVTAEKDIRNTDERGRMNQTIEKERSQRHPQQPERQAAATVPPSSNLVDSRASNVKESPKQSFENEPVKEQAADKTPPSLQEDIPKAQRSPLPERQKSSEYVGADQVQVESKTEHKYERPKFNRTTSLDSSKDEPINDTSSQDKDRNQAATNQPNEPANRPRQENRDKRNDNRDRLPRRDFQRDGRMRDSRDRDIRDNRDRFQSNYPDHRNERFDRNDRPNDRNDRRFNRNDRYQDNKRASDGNSNQDPKRFKYSNRQ
ncbi:THO complex subunit 2 [Terramyces sp. JEL0728]|nr:THO complex subunit 2 [Terramyces sp. JEL0728]